MLTYAEQLGYRRKGSNPCKGVSRYKRKLPDRYLSPVEYRRLARTLAEVEAEQPTVVAALRLLMFTGARSGEITRLKWAYVQPPRLMLPDSKTGPKIIYLNGPAQEVLDALPRGELDDWVLPMRDAPHRPVELDQHEPLPFKPEDVEVIRRSLYGVTQEGTSTRVFVGAPYRSGGKTGTAQAVTIRQNEKYNASRLAEYQRDHSLYTAFAPLENPTVALAVIVENAGFGAEAAAPIARRVLDYVLLGRYPTDEDIALVQQGHGSAPSGPGRAASDVPLPMPHGGGSAAPLPPPLSSTTASAPAGGTSP